MNEEIAVAPSENTILAAHTFLNQMKQKLPQQGLPWRNPDEVESTESIRLSWRKGQEGVEVLIKEVGGESKSAFFLIEEGTRRQAREKTEVFDAFRQCL